jgi:hypothetical protein
VTGGNFHDDWGGFIVVLICIIVIAAGIGLTEAIGR